MQPASIHRESHRRARPAKALMVLAAVSALLLAGCGAGRSSNTSTQARTNGAAPAPQSVGPNGTPGTGTNSAPGADSSSGTKNSAPGAGTSAESKAGAPVPAAGPKLTRSANLDVRVTSVNAAAAQVRAIATGLQAQVLNEQIGTGSPGGPVPLQSEGKPVSQAGFGTLTLSVPADKLDTALDQIARGVGTVQQRNLSTQDVTAQYVDTESRLKSMRASVERVRALMTQAKDIGQVVVLEGELSRRESDLESLESQLGALKNSVERSTLTVTLSTPGHETVTESGFVAGLHAGWDAFTASARGLLTVIGAVLPFAVFFALVAAPIVWWVRRRRSASATPVKQ